MCTNPPGAANALTASVSSTMNVHGRFGLRAGLRQHAADQRDVAVDGGVLHDAVARAHAFADRRAQLLLFGVGDLQLAETAARA